MKKLTLDLDSLRVDTFATDREGGARGTVQGHDDDDDTLPTEFCSQRPCTKTGCPTQYGQNTCDPYC